MPFFRNREETELEREIAHHLRELAAEYERQGHSRAEAALLAKRAFGGSALVKERCRDERRGAWLTGLKQDIVFGLRMMRRTPVITASAVLSLALGIGAGTAIASLMDAVLWRSLPVPEPDRLAIIDWQSHGFPRDLVDSASGSFMKDGGWDVADFFSGPAFFQMRDRVSALAALAAFSWPDAVSVSFADRPTVAQARPVSGNFFSTLSVRAQYGRVLAGHDDARGAPPAVVVSHRFWVRELASDPGAIGRTMRIDNTPYVIVGVLDPSFYGLFPSDAAELYTPLQRAFRRFGGSGDPMEDNRFWGLSLIARRKPGVDEARLRMALDTSFPATWSRQPKDPQTRPRIRLLPGGRGLGMVAREFQNSLLVLGGLVTLLLVIACTNIANLLLARAVARQKEVGMRISLGCSRTRLMRQFLTESTLLALLGGAASILVAWLTANLLGQFLEGMERIPLAVALDSRILILDAGITCAALLTFGLFPAWRASRFTETGWLTHGMSSAPGRKWKAGGLLVVAQMGMSVILVMAAVIFTRNLLGIESTDPGFDRRNLVIYGLRPGTSGYEKSRLEGFYFNLEQRLRTTSGVAGAGLASMRPMNIGGWWDSVRLANQKNNENATINGITPGYLPLFVSHLTAGRNITWADVAGEAKVAVISEDLARKLGGAAVLGQMLQFPDGPPGVKPREFQIVGIAPVIAATSMKERPYAVWLPIDKNGLEVTVVLRTNQPPRVAMPAIRQAMNEIDRNLPLADLTTMEQQISKGLQRERMFATLCSGFGVLALVLSIVGLYGVIAYSTSRRRSEIGLRLALGATPGNVASMVVREGLLLAGLGMLLGLPVVWMGAKYLEKELTGLKPLEPASFVLSLGILLASAFIAVGVPAIRASALQPAETLRQE